MAIYVLEFILRDSSTFTDVFLSSNVPITLLAEVGTNLTHHYSTGKRVCTVGIPVGRNKKGGVKFFPACHPLIRDK